MTCRHVSGVAPSRRRASRILPPHSPPMGDTGPATMQRLGDTMWVVKDRRAITRPLSMHPPAPVISVSVLPPRPHRQWMESIPQPHRSAFGGPAGTQKTGALKWGASAGPFDRKRTDFVTPGHVQGTNYSDGHLSRRLVLLQRFRIAGHLNPGSIVRFLELPRFFAHGFNSMWSRARSESTRSAAAA